MNELTPEQKKLQEEIQKKVGTLKFFRTHVRWAGLVLQIAGLLSGINGFLVWGTFIFFLSYVATSSIMEDITLLIWDRSNEESEKKENEETEE